MKKLLILLLIPFLVGCLPIHSAIDTALRQEPGWNMSGYVIRDDSKEIKIGSISSEILYGLAENSSRDRKLEEDIKDEGFVFGIFFKKSF